MLHWPPPPLASQDGQKDLTRTGVKVVSCHRVWHIVGAQNVGITIIMILLSSSWSFYPSRCSQQEVEMICSCNTRSMADPEIGLAIQDSDHHRTLNLPVPSPLPAPSPQSPRRQLQETVWSPQEPVCHPGPRDLLLFHLLQREGQHRWVWGVRGAGQEGRPRATRVGPEARSPRPASTGVRSWASPPGLRLCLLRGSERV